MLMLTASLSWAIAQNRTITGTVTSGEKKEPVMFANVVVEGNTSIGTTTDVDGKFSLSVPASAKRLVFSYVGLKTTTVEISNVMNVVMSEDGQVLDQVVVVGYGTGQKLSTISGSMARVTSEEIANRPVANVMDAMQGKVAGMQVQTSSGDPNAVANVSIHGKGSLGASTTPLYIVDGMQTELSTVMAMNPNDFESVNVLMDASSTSIYGARAANGVVVITTKRGKSNDEGDGHIVFNAQYGISEIITRKPFEVLMTAEELLEYQARHEYMGVPAGNVQALKDAMVNATPPQGKQKWYVPSYNEDFKDFDWVSFFMGKKAPTYQGDLSISGGTNKTSYYISLGVLSQQGIYRERNFYDRYSGRINLDTRVKSWLKVGTNLSGAYTRSISPSFESTNYYNTGTMAIYTMPPYLSPYDKDGNRREHMVSGDQSKDWTFLDQSEPYLNEYTDAYQANIAAYAQLNPLEGLTIKTQAGLDATFDIASRTMKAGRPFVKGDKRGFRSERRGVYNNFTWTNTAEYKFNFLDRHALTLLAGQEWIDYKYNSIGAVAQGFEDQDFILLGQGSSDPNMLSLPSQSIGGYRYLSFFGRANYAFENYLYLDLSLRSDSSSKFGPEKRTGVFYSFGAMYDLYRAHLSHVNWLNALRVRASWGTTGNSSIPSLAWQPILGKSNYRNNLGIGIASPGNPKLGWETQSNLNLGVDFDAFDNRLHAVVNGYMRITDDMLMTVPMPYSSGWGSLYENVGSMRNTGIDLTLSYDFIKTRDWNVYASTTFNYNDERITKLFYGLDKYPMPNKGIMWTVGKPQTFLISRFAGVNPDNGNPQWYQPVYDADGKPTGDVEITEDYNEQKLLQDSGKRVTAPIAGGFSFGASWKGLALDLDWAYELGRYTINNDRFFIENNQENSLWENKSRKMFDEWQKKGDQTDVPKYGTQNVFDDRLLESTSYLRLKNIRLSYTLPSSLFENVPVITGASVYVLARNLWTLTSYKGFDPEATRNVSMNAYPNTKQYVAGLQLTF